jgi:hypothetical protein
VTPLNERCLVSWRRATGEQNNGIAALYLNTRLRGLQRIREPSLHLFATSG